MFRRNISPIPLALKGRENKKPAEIGAKLEYGITTDSENRVPPIYTLCGGKISSL
jgi:hypothetical protein